MASSIPISMESRGCNADLLRRLYVDDRMTVVQLSERFLVGKAIISRWMKQSGISKRDSNSTYDFNKNYFDIIDDQRKAYWMGFIWCDGYVCNRIRENRDVYEFKLSLAEQDRDHLDKLKLDLEANYEIKEYVFKGFGKYTTEFRLYIANMYFAKNLHDNYGLIADRSDTRKLLERIPLNLHRHFIRGIMDAEGSIVDCYINDSSKKYNKSRKNNLNFNTYEEIIDFIQDHFLNNKIIDSKSKKRKRHEDRDLHCIGITYCGNIQVPRILNYLYEDAEVYLDRKYKKYQTIINTENEVIPKDVEKERVKVLI